MIQKNIYNNSAQYVNQIGLINESVNSVAENILSPINNLLYIYNNETPQDLNSGNNKVNYFQTMINKINLIKLNNNSSKKTRNFVQKLQIHVSKKYGSVNNFLLDNNIKVGTKFAQVSSQVGYVINMENIE